MSSGVLDVNVGAEGRTACSETRAHISRGKATVGALKARIVAVDGVSMRAGQQHRAHTGAALASGCASAASHKHGAAACVTRPASPPARLTFPAYEAARSMNGC
jgi:hypothetical protein